MEKLIIYLNDFLYLKTVKQYIDVNCIDKDYVIFDDVEAVIGELMFEDHEIIVFDYHNDVNLIDSLKMMEDSITSIKVFCKNIETAKQYIPLTEDIQIIPDPIDITVWLYNHVAFSLGNALSVKEIGEEILTNDLIPIEGENEGVLFNTIIKAYEDVDIVQINLQNVLNMAAHCLSSKNTDVTDVYTEAQSCCGNDSEHYDKESADADYYYTEELIYNPTSEETNPSNIPTSNSPSTQTSEEPDTSDSPSTSNIPTSNSSNTSNTQTSEEPDTSNTQTSEELDTHNSKVIEEHNHSNTQTIEEPVNLTTVEEVDSITNIVNKIIEETKYNNEIVINNGVVDNILYDDEVQMPLDDITSFVEKITAGDPNDADTIAIHSNEEYKIKGVVVEDDIKLNPVVLVNDEEAELTVEPPINSDNCNSSEIRRFKPSFAQSYTVSENDDNIESCKVDNKSNEPEKYHFKPSYAQHTCVSNSTDISESNLSSQINTQDTSESDSISTSESLESIEKNKKSTKSKKSGGFFGLFKSKKLKETNLEVSSGNNKTDDNSGNASRLSSIRKKKLIQYVSEKDYFEKVYPERDISQQVNEYLTQKNNSNLSARLEDYLLRDNLINEEEYLIFMREYLKKPVLLLDELFDREIIFDNYDKETCKLLNIVEVESKNGNRTIVISADDTKSKSHITTINKGHNDLNIIYTMKSYMEKRIQKEGD